jgi:hypothetical protein
MTRQVKVPSLPRLAAMCLGAVLVVAIPLTLLVQWRVSQRADVPPCASVGGVR